MHAIRSSARYAALILLCCLSIFQSPPAWGQPATGAEYAVKAGFIYNFINFVTWPEAAFKDNPDQLVLCFYSEDPQSSVLFKLEGKIVKGRTLKVLAYKDSSCLAQSHAIFLGTQDEQFVRQVLEQAAGRNILTIGEIEAFARMGGVINFFKELNRLRFQVNIDAAQREALKMSSQLLQSAQIVHGENE
jgi:hypothetical protein